MTDARNRFAIPPEPALGVVRRFPAAALVAGAEADEGERVLVRFNGENTVYENPDDFVEAVLGAVAERQAKARRAELRPLIVIGVIIGLMLAPFVAKALVP